MGKVTLKEQTGNQKTVIIAAASASEWMHTMWPPQLTDDHEGEKVSVEEVPDDWLVPCFHADHSGDQVNEGDGLEGDETQNHQDKKRWDGSMFDSMFLCSSPN